MMRSLQSRQRIHVIGVAGRAMGAIAIALARAGHRVTGSDERAYPPMSDHLEAEGIVPTPYSAASVPPDADLAIVGKRVTPDNPEVAEVLRRGIPMRSFPRFLNEQFLQASANAVVAGGVGKTTTSAMLAWILEHAGLGPDYLIGGMAHNFEHPVRFERAPIAVLEGDEYPSAFDDPTPKFMHYAPSIAVVTNILEDHPDRYPTAETLHEAFRAFIGLVPPHGLVVLSADDDSRARLAKAARAAVVTTGFSDAADRTITHVCLAPDRSRFVLDAAPFELPLCGLMNIRNAAMAAVAASHAGVSFAQSAAALAGFKGVGQRQESREVGGCTVVSDKASHPRSLADLAQALRQRYPGRRLVSLIQPRATGGRHWIYQRDLPDALARFDKVCLTSGYEHQPPAETAWQHEPFSSEILAEALHARGVDLLFVRSLDDLPAAAVRVAQPGDVILVTLREQFAGHRAAVEDALFRVGALIAAAAAGPAPLGASDGRLRASQSDAAVPQPVSPTVPA